MMRTLLFLCFAAMVIRPADAAQKIPIILDTDIGAEIEDAFALALAATSPEVELVGVTSTGGDARTRAMIACRLLYAIGRKDVPVAVGASQLKKTATAGQHQYGLRPARKRPVRQNAVEFLYAKLKARPKQITLVAVGPLTNIAELFRKHPDCKPWVKRLVVMGGAIRVGDNGKPPAAPEGNIKTAIKAAKAVFNAGVSLVVAPLDATANLKLPAKQLAELFAAGNRVTNELRILHDLWNKETPVLFDPVAVTLSFTQRFCEMRELCLDVDDRGMMRVIKGENNAKVAMGIRKDAFLHWYVEHMRSAELVVHVAPDGGLSIGEKTISLADVLKLAAQRQNVNLQLNATIAAHAKTPFVNVVRLTGGLKSAGVKNIRISKSRRLLKPTNVAKPVPETGRPHRVHVFEDYETDIERRWWLSGRLETKDVPPSLSKSVPNRRACRATLTHNFDGRMGDPTRLFKAVIFNPVPGPPMGPRTRLSFRYKLKGTGTLRVQIYTLSKGYHRFLTLTNLKQNAWRSATVDMTKCRRPDGSGGPLSKDERIDDIQFYTAPDAELLIDDIVLYDAAMKGDATEKFPRRFLFTGWFDTGKQGREWPGDFKIVLHEKPRTWDFAESVLNKKTGQPWIRVDLRGRRPLSAKTRVRFQYRLSTKSPIRVVLRNAKTGRDFTHTLKSHTVGKWSDTMIDFAIPKTRKGELGAVSEIQFHTANGATLHIDDLLIYEPR